MENEVVCPNIYVEDITNGLENVKISFINGTNQVPLSKSVLYITKNILSSDSLVEDFESMPLPCKCLVCSDHCSCAFGAKIAYENTLLAEDFVSNSSRPIMECSNLCECGNTCSNRLVQQGIKFPLQVFLTENKGFGVQTLESIPKFSFVCEYAGELIDKKEAEQRIKNRSKEEPNYIFILKEHTEANSYLYTIIDPTYTGNVGRYLNHSCNPNLFPVPIRVDSMLPRVCFFSMRDIKPCEELTYNYGIDEHQEAVDDAFEQNQKSKPCLCNALNCSGLLPFDARALV